MITQQIKLGKFAQDSSGTLYGRITGLGIGTTVVVSEESVSQNGVTYLKLIADQAKAAYEVGVAFPKEKDGMNYYSVVLDSPLFPMPIGAALFPDKENEGMFNLVWNRLDARKYTADANNGVGPGRRFIGSDATP